MSAAPDIVSIFKIIDCNLKNKVVTISNKWTNEIKQWKKKENGGILPTGRMTTLAIFLNSAAEDNWCPDFPICDQGRLFCPSTKWMEQPFGYCYASSPHNCWVVDTLDMKQNLYYSIAWNFKMNTKLGIRRFKYGISYYHVDIGFDLSSTTLGYL